MWKGSASVVDGIDFVSNPDAPLFGDEDISVVELWRVRPGISDSLWTNPTRLLATEDGVYVLDPSSSSIALVNPTGVHRLSFGGSGMGPGELRNPGALAVIDSLIAVLNGGNGRIEFFTLAGQYSHSKRLPGPTFSMLALNCGTLLVNVLRGDTAVWVTTSASADAGDHPYHFRNSPAADSLLSECGQVGTIRDGNVLRLRCTAPAVTVFDSSGEPRVVFGIDRAPAEASDEQLARLEALLSAGYRQAGYQPEAARMFVRRQVEKQRVLHAYRKVFGDGNIILIWEQVPVDLGNSPSTLHVFNAHGVYLARLDFARRGRMPTSSAIGCMRSSWIRKRTWPRSLRTKSGFQPLQNAGSAATARDPIPDGLSTRAQPAALYAVRIQSISSWSTSSGVVSLTL